MRNRGLALLLVAAALLASAQQAEAARVRIRARSLLEARAVPRAGHIEIRGTLKDDSGRPIGQARVELLQPGAATPLLPEGCDESERPRATGRGHAVDTDGAGAFCIRLPGSGQTSLALRFEGDRYYDPTSVGLTVDSSRRSLALRFSPEPRFLPLERASHAIWVETRIEPPDPDAPPESIHLKLSLRTREGTERKLVAQNVVAGERVELAVPSRALGEPGPATLVAAFAGSETLAPADRSTVVQRTLRVNLAVAGAPAGGDPTEGIEIPVAVGSGLGAVPGGSVEALVRGESVGVAPVVAGAARVLAVFDAPHGGTVPVSVRYLPDAPWWLPGEPVAVPVAVEPPSPWRRWPWILAALAIAVWVVRGWLRPARREKKPSREEAAAPTGRASVDVIERGPPRSGWRGRVLDAHDGTPVEGARVTILIPAFAGSGRAGRTTTDAEGSFELAHVEGATAEGAEIEVTAAWHSRLARRLPPPGFVAIHVVSRRRALLERLVQWAGRMGRPWNDRGEPTPGYVARIARDKRQTDVEGWAAAVERAAFGPEPPDEAEERKVRDREPEWRGNAR